MVIWAYLDSDGTKLIGNYIVSWMIKYMIAFALILWVWYRSKVPYRWEVLGVFLVFCAVAWISFDLAYNLFNPNVAWDHLGTTAFSDRWFPSFWTQAAAKGALLGAGVFITVKL